MQTESCSDSLAKAIRTTVLRLTFFRDSRPTVRPQVVPGFTPAFSVRTKSTRRFRGTRRIILGTAGASPGRPIAASYIIERAPNRPASHGAIERNWFGGTRGNTNGPASTSPIFRRKSHRNFGRPETRVDLIQFRAMRRL